MEFSNKKVSPEEYIIATATRLEIIANRHVFSAMNLSLSSVKILGFIACKKNVTSTDILNSIGGTRSNISQRLDHLEKAGYITRKFASFAEDRRKVTIKITKHGMGTLGDVSRRFEKARKELYANFSQAELDANEAFCKKMLVLLNSPDSKLKKLFHI